MKARHGMAAVSGTGRPPLPGPLLRGRRGSERGVHRFHGALFDGSIFLSRLIVLVVFCSCGLAKTSQGAEKKALTAPSFSIAGGIYTNRVRVQLSVPAPGAVVRFTMDGPEPS